MLTSLSLPMKSFLLARCGFFGLLLSLLVGLPLAAQAGQPGLRWVEQNFSVFHGIPARVLLGLDEKQATAAAQSATTREIEAVFADIERRFNAYDPQSDLARLNASLQTAVVVEAGFGRELGEIWGVAREVAEASDGAFDPTIWPFKQLWQNAQKTQIVPSATQLAAAAKAVGYTKLRLLSETQIERPAGTMLDLGGIVKGYGVDRLTALLKARGIRNGLVQIGGEVRVFGRSEAGSWRVGIQDPLDMTKLFGVIALSAETAISTSGNYRQPIEIGGLTYYHLFDPKTGQPIPTDLLGITVFSSTSRSLPSTFADAFTKTLAVGGVEKGLALAAQKGVEVLAIFSGGAPERALRVVQSTGFQRVFTRLADH